MGAQGRGCVIRALPALLRRHALTLGFPEAPCGALMGTPARGRARQAPSAPLRSHAVVVGLPEAPGGAPQGHARVRKCNTFWCYAVTFGPPEAPCDVREVAQARGSALRRAPSLPCSSLRATGGALRCPQGHAGAQECNPSAFGAPSLPWGSFRDTRGALRCARGRAGAQQCNPSVSGAPLEPCGSSLATPRRHAVPPGARGRAEVQHERRWRFFAARR